MHGRGAFIWCGVEERRERESGRCLAGNEFDSRQSALSAFSPLILIVGRTDRAPPSSFSFLPFCAAAAGFPGHGNSQIYILDGRRKRYFSAIWISLCIIQCRCRRASLWPLCRLLNGTEEQSFLGGALFSHFHRDVTSTSPVWGIMIGARWESRSIHPKISA